MDTSARPSVEQLILDAATDVHDAPTGAEPWVFGWSLSDYRNLDTAALPGQQGPVGIGRRGIEALETAMQALLSDEAVSARWDPEELWGLVAELIVAVHESTEPGPLVVEYVRRLREVGPSLVVLPVANVAWESPPCRIGGGVLGTLDQKLISEVSKLAAESESRLDLASSDAQDWIGSQSAASGATSDEPAGAVVAVVWTPSQRHRAVEDAERWFEQLCCLALLFDDDPAGRKMWSQRGSHNRPGARGLIPDRASLEELLKVDDRGGLELECEPFVSSPDFGTYRPIHWYSADPVPLDLLLIEPAIRAAVGRSVTVVDESAKDRDVVPRRLRFAARWYADAHWADHAVDAALSLGVALEVLVGARANSSSGVMAKRFACLEPDPMARHEASRRFKELYGVRSGVAHGGLPSKLAEPDFIRSFADDVRQAARQLDAFGHKFRISSEDELDDAFEALTSGKQAW